MSSVIHEKNIEEKSLPGRKLRWLINKELADAEHCSSCVIRIEPGQTVKPAHSHPNGEEIIYIITGKGRVWINGEISNVEAGTAVLFPQGLPHMTQNTGDEEMKVICFFAPPSNLADYKLFSDLEFTDVNNDKV
jgi:quercetin dioxygenase-like cupin family protein